MSGYDKAGACQAAAPNTRMQHDRFAHEILAILGGDSRACGG
jgi:hypothetical protein